MKHYNIPIFVPHKGCPNDCVFCNQKKITAHESPMTPEEADRTIEEYLKTLPDNSYKEVAFFGGSFTGIPIEEQEALLNVAKKYYDSGVISGIRLSTRPDYINEEILELLKSKDVTTIELGVQSMDDEVLRLSNRGHKSEAVIEAAELIKKYGFSLGLQMMTGLPGDTFQKSVNTAEKFIEIKPEFVRIYPTLVIKDTRLAEMYYSGEYRPQTTEEAVELCRYLKKMFLQNEIRVIRVSLQPTEEISPEASVVAGPFHPAFGELVDSAIYYDLISEVLADYSNCRVILGVNSREISKAVGNGKININKIKKEKNIALKIKAIQDIDTGVKLIGVE